VKNPLLSAQDSLHDEVAYVLTTAALLKVAQSAVKTDQQKRWQPKRQKTSDFRKCENAACSAVAINRTCSRHPERLVMACSTVCHKIAKTQLREHLAAIQPQTDADMARRKDRCYNEIERISAACTDSAYAQTDHA
jgi:hypothetical protein